MLLHRLLGELTDGFFPVLSEFDDQIDDMQDAILAKPTDAQLADLFTLKRWLIMARKVITPQRDMIASLVSGVTELPGMTPGHRAVFPRPVRPPDPDQRPGGQLP